MFVHLTSLTILCLSLLNNENCQETKQNTVIRIAMIMVQYHKITQKVKAKTSVYVHAYSC